VRKHNVVAASAAGIALAMLSAGCGSTSKVSNSSTPTTSSTAAASASSTPGTGGASAAAGTVSWGQQICAQNATLKPAYPAPFSPVAGGSKTLSGAGSTFVAPVMSVWTKDYSTQAGVQVAYQSIGSGGGVQQIQAQTVDFGDSDTGMTDSEIAASKGGAGSILQIPVVVGGVVVAYNLPGVPAGLKFDGPTLGKIFAGEITSWDDPAMKALNPGITLPSLPIAVAHRSDGSGTTGIWTHFLTQVSPDWVTKLGGADKSDGKTVAWPVGIGGKGNEGVSGVIGQTKGGLGYVELQYAVAQNLTYGQIKNSAGNFIQPCAPTIEAATEGVTYPDNLNTFLTNAGGANAYPVSGDTYVLVYMKQTDAAKAAALVNFLGWVLSKGQDEASPLAYVPLGQGLQAKAVAQLKKITVNGQPVIAGQ
jgi:phosphate transport system substrate-binding protein